MSEYIEQMVDNDEMPEELLAVGDTWKIRDDASADWAIRRIAAVIDDCDRKIAVCKERIANLQKLIDKYQQEKGGPHRVVPHPAHGVVRERPAARDQDEREVRPAERTVSTQVPGAGGQAR